MLRLALLLSLSIVVGCTNTITRSSVNTVISSTPSPENNGDPIYQPEKLTDIIITSSNIRALIVYNANTYDFGRSEFIGYTPQNKTNTSLQRPSEAPVSGYRQDLPQSHFKSSPTTQSLITQSSLTPQKVTESTPTFNFLAYNFISPHNSPLTIETTLRYGSKDSKCLIYLQKDLPTPSHINDIGTYFDTVIYPKITENFASPYDVDENGKTVIVYYPIEVSDPENGSLLGYVRTQDFFTNTSRTYSNEMDVLAMNSLLLEPERTSKNYGTLAHEFTHVVHFSYRIENNKLIPETWVSEGLAECGHEVAINTPLTSQIELFKTSAHIRNGWPLIYWGNSYLDYSVAYTFLRFTQIQSNNTTFYKSVIQNNNDDYLSIQESISNSALNSFSKTMQAYTIANLVNLAEDEYEGIYGYKEQRDIFNISQLDAGDPFNAYLFPGGSMYLYPTEEKLNNFIPDTAGTNIRYIRINKTSTENAN